MASVRTTRTQARGTYGKGRGRGTPPWRDGVGAGKLEDSHRPHSGGEGLCDLPPTQWRKGGHLAFEDILVPTDFGPGSRAALERALDSLGSEGGRVGVLHIVDQRLLEPTLLLFPAAREADLLTRLHEQAHQRYTQLIAGLERDKVEFELLLVEGVPFLKIVQFAHDLDVDLIIMAVHRGPAHFEQLLFGSTAERVMRVAPCPVLIVPEAPVSGAEEVHPAGGKGNTGAAQP